MPKKIAVFPNERIDIPDYLRGANDYTQESDSFLREKILQSRRALVLEGFRIQIPDQTTSPGQISIYNGNALDRDGNHLYNEDQENDSRTVTLSGGSTTFYLEVEFTEVLSDTDARAFMDPTYVNGGTEPPGREFSLSVATRYSPDWQIVTPVSTTGFESTTDPDSTKIPIAVLTTNASNQVTTAVNTGLVLVAAASKLESDVLAGVTQIRLLDTRLFPDTGVCTVDFGDVSAEASINITVNDRANGILTISPALSSNHLAGAIVRVTGAGVSTFVRERTTAAPATGHPDHRRKMFVGDEIRGSALVESKETYGSRSDNDIKNLKDQVDALSSVIREMKFGTLRTGTFDNTTLPTPFISNRWYDFGGSLQGSKSKTITIGDGANSFGDFNVVPGTDELGSVLNDAILLLDSSRGGSIVVKAGIYPLESTINIDRNVHLIFDRGAELEIDVDNLIDITGLCSVYVEGLKAVVIVGADDKKIVVSSTNGADLRLFDCEFGSIDATGVTAENGLYLDMRKCTLSATSGNHVLYTEDGSNVPVWADSSISASHVIEDCILIQTDPTAFHLNGNMRNLVVRNTSFSGGASFYGGTPAGSYLLEDIKFENCTFSSDDLVSVGFNFNTDGNSVENVVFDGCDFNSLIIDFVDTADLLYFESSSNVVIRNCHFSDAEFTSTGSGDIGSYVHFESPTNCIVELCEFGERAASVDDGNQWRVPVMVTSSTSTNSLTVRNNSMRYFYRGVTHTGVSTACQLTIEGNEFYNLKAGFDAIRDDAAVHLTTTSSHSIRNNKITMAYDDIPTPLVVSGIYVSAITTASNQYIEGNTVVGPSAADVTADGTVYSIFTNAEDVAHKVSVCGNKITQGLMGAGGSTFGIASNSDDGTVTDIAANDITAALATAIASETAIQSDGDGNSQVNIYGNNIRFIHTGTAAVISRVIGILSNRTSVDSNNIIYGTTFGGTSDCIYISAGTGTNTVARNILNCAGTGAALTRCVFVGESCARIQVVNNTIIGGTSQTGSLVETYGTNESVCITGNSLLIQSSIQLNRALNVGTSAAGTVGVVVSGNSIIEFGATHVDRILIRISSVTGLSVASNVVNAAASSTASNRGAAAYCIDISSCTRVAVTGNVVEGWGDANTDASVFSITSTSAAAVTGNVFGAGSGSASRVTVVIGATDAVVDSNVYGDATRNGTITAPASGRYLLGVRQDGTFAHNTLTQPFATT